MSRIGKNPVSVPAGVDVQLLKQPIQLGHVLAEPAPTALAAGRRRFMQRTCKSYYFGRSLHVKSCSRSGPRRHAKSKTKAPHAEPLAATPASKA